MRNFLLCFALSVLTVGQVVLATRINPSVRQQLACSTNADCNLGFFFPVNSCDGGVCVAPAPPARTFTRSLALIKNPVGATCGSVRECQMGLVCVGGNPLGTCRVPEGPIGLAHLVVNLIQEDYTSGTEANPLGRDVGPSPMQPTPLKTSRAIAMIFLAAHDAYGILTGNFEPQILRETGGRPFEGLTKPDVADATDAQITSASLIAGYAVAKLLYEESEDRINSVQEASTVEIPPEFTEFANALGAAWFAVRQQDGSERPLRDSRFEIGDFLRHQPDPNFLRNTGDEQENLGREWGSVRPFVINDVREDAFLGPFPGPETEQYRENLAEVEKFGECNEITQDGVPVNDIGIFWGYDGAPDIGVPPRLYLQIVLAVKELNDLPAQNQFRALAAVGSAMADAGIAAWVWKFEYDLWRPVVGIREDTTSPNPDWNPRGIGLSNIVTDPRQPVCIGTNPDFPAYPSGHASFGSAAFRTLAGVLGVNPSALSVTFTSDEFNGRTIEGTTGEVRGVLTRSFTLQEGIDENNDSRVFVGVHWRFDSEGGDLVGKQIAAIVAEQFSLL